ncbi:MAG: hypothetical protein KAJ49_03285, partial [Arcobacteraceae bacterium]|nr:hypothetical protein [Arcobacteraceae bacterium]
MKNNILQSLIHTTINSSNIKDIKEIQTKFNENPNITTILKDKNVQTLLKDLVNDLVSQNKTTKMVLDILKNEPIFKEFKSFSGELKSLISLLEKSNIKSDIIPKFKTQIIDIKNIDDKILKDNIGKSGVFLESYLKNLSNKLNNIKLKNELKQNIFEDVKTIL